MPSMLPLKQSLTTDSILLCDEEFVELSLEPPTEEEMEDMYLSSLYKNWKARQDAERSWNEDARVYGLG